MRKNNENDFQLQVFFKIYKVRNQKGMDKISKE
jgi:hypothetical protein